MERQQLPEGEGMPTITPEELARVRAFIESAPWRFAKTTPNDPHAYVLKDQVDPAEFEWFRQLVERVGYDEAFQATWMDRSVTWRYIRLDGHHYWFSKTGRKVPYFVNRARDPRPDYPPPTERN